MGGAQVTALDPVVIGAREIYDQGQKTQAALDKLVDKMGGLGERLGDHENRLRMLERARWPLPSLAVLLSVASLATAIIMAAYR